MQESRGVSAAISNQIAPLFEKLIPNHVISKGPIFRPFRSGYVTLYIWFIRVLTASETVRKFQRINAVERQHVEEALENPSAKYSLNSALQDFPEKRNRYGVRITKDSLVMVLTG
ncbi:hypothetical protein BABINDRAFT_106869 [Babjeviella inositovora NRRL Y-12698]|uniref:Uncharacterized protein n=1 Tax=Babjeviella inositovora NRRL Y-12698 TaxID=984486 RepID=A0A1E3QH50_9ASCO|nr:uncharacterized protein BABINDRAFT_106869 [Babjeviella inositovora NRRL Y-12698]ODQ77025.1 hypothetical protein BABINDRAFT_106869 [Babjeviella inositovora NRRL Y-12698]